MILEQTKEVLTALLSITEELQKRTWHLLIINGFLFVLIIILFLK
jgi:hypothetical protein